MSNIRTLVGRANGGRRVGLGAGPQFIQGEKQLEIADPSEFRRVLLAMPPLLTASGVGGVMRALPQDIYQVDWFTIQPVVVRYNLTSTTLPATQLDWSDTFTISDIRVGTVPQMLTTDEMPITAFREWSQMPDFVFDAGQTTKQFEVTFENNGPTVTTLRAVATALKAM